MVSYDDALTIMARQAQDSSATAQTFLLLNYNVYYRKILIEFGRPVTEKTVAYTLTAGNRSFTVAPDCEFPKNVEMQDGLVRYSLVEVASEKMWSMMKSGAVTGRPTHYHYSPTFGMGGGALEMFPIPSSSNYIINLTYEAQAKDLSQAAYTTGTVTLTNNNAAVVGAGTTFTAAMIGRYLVPTTAGADAMPYEIIGFTDATHITLNTPYIGTTTAGLSYKIVEVPLLPEDMQILPCYGALQEWWSSKGNTAKTQEFEQKFVQGMQLGKKTHAVVTRDEVVGEQSPVLPFPVYPFYFPTSFSET